MGNMHDYVCYAVKHRDYIAATFCNEWIWSANNQAKQYVIGNYEWKREMKCDTSDSHSSNLRSVGVNNLLMLLN